MLSHNKICNLEDFHHPELRTLIRQIFPHEVLRFGEAFPAGHEYRKYWEVAMAVRSLHQGGWLTPRSEVLGVGAGNEPTIFFLTTQVHRVFATDLYLTSSDWSYSAAPSMFTSPGKYWPGAWNPRHLVVQHMNALELQYDNESFDGIFTSSSVEHFGSISDIERAVSEMFRVLRPGGLLSLSTEFRLRGAVPGLPNIMMFDESQIREVILDGFDWSPISPLDLTVSSDTMSSQLDFFSAAQDVREHLAQHNELIFHELTWKKYPHIVLREKDLLWTSIHLALRKAAKSRQ